MRYTLLLSHEEPGEGEVSEEAMVAMQEAFGRYGRDLEAAGVLVAAEVLESSGATRTFTLRNGSSEVTDGPFTETKESLAGVFVIDVPDAEAALHWAKKCPAAQYGVLEIRRSATSCINGVWT